MNLKAVVFFLFSLFASNLLWSQDLINWMSWDEVVTELQKEEKKIVVDVHTSWCEWCKTMDKSTYQNPKIAAYVNEHYYAVKFDAEYKEDIIFNNKIYSFVRGSFGTKGHHELAEEILNGRMSYPTVVFIDENQKVIQPIPGYQDPKTFEMIMTFFAENVHNTMPWAKYTHHFQSKLFPGETTPASFQPAVQTVKDH